MSDVSDVETNFDSVDYEIHTSPSVPTDLKGIVILCYNHDIQFRYRVVWVKLKNDSIADTFSCEFLRNFALNVCCNVKPFSANLFHLFDGAGKHLVPLGKPLNSQSTFLLRMIWKPRDLMKLHDADPAALRYLYHQCHDDFVYGDTIERISLKQRTLESLLGIVIFDMVAFALNSEPKIELKELKRRYRAKQFMNEKILTDIEPIKKFRSIYRMINTFRINRNCRENLGKHYRDFVSQGSENSNEGALNVMLSYIKAITDNVPSYFVINGQMADEDKMVVIDHPQNRIYVRHSDGTKEELFDITKLQRYDGIDLSMAQVRNENGELHEVWTLRLHITKPQYEWQRIDLHFASSDEAHHVAAALVSLYQSMVIYPCHELTTNELLAPPSVVKLKKSGYHGPLSDSVAQKLMLNTTEQPGFSLLRQSPDDWQVYYVDVYGCSPKQNDPQENPPPSSSGSGTTHLLKYVIRSSDHKFRITECYDLSLDVNHPIEMNEPEFDSLCGPNGLLFYYRSSGKTAMLKDFIPPSLKHRAGFPIEVEVISEKQTIPLENSCSQPHIIPSSELEISTRSENLLGEGRFTRVHGARWKRKKIAVKIINAEDSQTLERRLQMSTSRVLGLRSKFIMDIYGFSIDSVTQYVLLEYCSHGSISSFLLQIEIQRQLKKKHLLKAQRQMLNGLEFLHGHNSYHGNLQCRNVFVMSFSEHDMVIKLADPGLKMETPLTNRLNISKEKEMRKDLCSYADTVCEMYSIWAPPERVIIDEVPSCPIHCPDELFQSVLLKCFNHTVHPNLAAADVSRDLTFFEQGFSGQNLAFFTSDVNRVGSSALESDIWQPYGASGDPILPGTLIDRVLLRYDEKKTSSTLGQGHFGQVFKGTYMSRPCAIKRLHQKYSDNMEQDKELEKEFEIMSQLKHTSIVEVFGRCLPIREAGQAEPYLMVMEFMEGKSVIERLHDTDAKTKFSAAWLKDWALQIAQGLEYLHSKNIIHRDLACRNILLTKDYKHIKISDFGLARLLDERSYYKCGQRELPMYWLAPEGFPGVPNARCVTASDIWSYGIVLWELFSYGKRPKDEQLYSKYNSYNELWKLFKRTTTRLSKPDNCPEEMYQLMNNCWQFEYSIRPSASDIINSLADR